MKKDYTQQINKLLSKMSLEEKIEQLTMRDLNELELDANGDVTADSLEKLFKGRSCGVLQAPFQNTSQEDIAKRVVAAQRYLCTKTAHKIPAIPLTEGLHGALIPNTTMFPQSIALGSMWSPELIAEMSSVIAKEATSCGVKQLLAPVFDVIRDHRWGRVEECYSEDPYLVTQCGKAYVEGAQGKASESRCGLAFDKVACTAKHFIGYSMPLRGMNLGPTLLGKREILSTFLEPFDVAINEANIYSVMPSYSEIDGVPVHANREIVTTLLRDTLNFKGYVISDYLGINMLNEFQKTAQDKREAALQAFDAGVDLEAPIFDIYQYLTELVAEGKISEQAIDISVTRLLKTKFLAGLFEKDNSTLVAKPKIRRNHKLSQKLAENAVILLENRNHTLPLTPKKELKIAVIGPNANNVQFGDYSWTNHKSAGVSIADGIRELYGKSAQIKVAQGCELWLESTQYLPEAIKLAEWADVVILGLGETSMPLGGVGWEPDHIDNHPMCGEGFDVDNTVLPKCQLQLLEAIAKVKKVLITVVINGRPLVLSQVAKHSDALLEGWYCGEASGQAIANIISGLVNPSGRLPVSMPRSVGQMPLYYNCKPSSNGFYHKAGSKSEPGRDYVFESPYPLYPFGFGLSYSSFKYSNMSVALENEKVVAKATITNTSNTTGKEVVQLYINDCFSSMTTPDRVLRRFAKLELTPNQSQEVCFELNSQDLALYDRNFEKKVEAGDFEIMFGRSAEDIIWQETIKIGEIL